MFHLILQWKVSYSQMATLVVMGQGRGRRFESHTPRPWRTLLLHDEAVSGGSGPASSLSVSSLSDHVTSATIIILIIISSVLE